MNTVDEKYLIFYHPSDKKTGQSGDGSLIDFQIDQK
jgi:hypothetical protein